MQHSYGAIGAPSVEHHRWQPLSRRPIAKRSGPFNRTARLLLHDMRWRRSPREHGLIVTGIVVSLLLHVLVFGSMLLIRPLGWPPPPTTSEDAIEVRFIEPEAPPPPPPPPPPLQRLPPRSKPVPHRVAAHAAARPTARQAPQLQPIPLPAQAAPRISMQARPTLAVPPPGAPQPLQRPPATLPEPVMRAMAMPPPPKVVLETSAMAVPPPPLQVEQVQPANVPSARLQPVPVPNPQELRGAPELAVTVPDALPGSMQPVLRPQAVAPSPDLAEVPLAAPALPDVTLEATPAPQQVETPLEPVAPAMRAPAAELAEIPVAPESSVLPDVDVQSMQPEVADMPMTAPSPLPAVEVAATPAATSPQSASTASPQTSWVRPGDQFAPAPEHSAAGRPNPSAHYDRNGRPSASPQTNGQGQGEPSGKGKLADYVQLYPRGNSDVMGRRSSMIDYRPTIFEQYWVPANESALDSLLRRFIENFTWKHTFHLGNGVRVNCVVGPIAIFIGCGGDPPRTASAKSYDPRLNMAPANPLVPGLGESAPAAPGSIAPGPGNDVECAMARVAGSPPPPGCPGAPVPAAQSDQWK